MVNWGPSSLNEIKKGSGESTQVKNTKSDNKTESLTKLEAIYKPIFERMFHKAILLQSLKNAL